MAHASEQVVKINGELVSNRRGNPTVVSSDGIYDYEKQKYQEDINEEVDEAISDLNTEIGSSNNPASNSIKGRLNTAEAAINLLNASGSTQGSIAKQIEDAKKEVIGSSSSDTDASQTIAGAKKYAEMLSSNLDRTVETLSNSLLVDIDDAKDGIAKEETRAKEAESELRTSIQSESSSRQSSITTLASTIADNKTDIENALSTEVARASTAEENLRTLYNNLQQSQPVPVTSLPVSGEDGKIYRLAGTTSYADYMWDGTQFIKMAEYDNAIDDEPTAGSDNLVKSGGIAEYLKNFHLERDVFVKGDGKIVDASNLTTSIGYIEIPYTYGAPITINGSYSVLHNNVPVYTYNFFNNNTYIGGTDELTSLPEGVSEANKLRINFHYIDTQTKVSTLYIIHAGVSYFYSPESRYREYENRISKSKLEVDSFPTESSSNLVTSGGVHDAILLGSSLFSASQGYIIAKGKRSVLSTGSFVSVPFSSGGDLVVRGTFRLLANNNPVYSYNFFNNDTYIGGTNDLTSMPTGIEDANICKINFTRTGSETLLETVQVVSGGRTYYYSTDKKDEILRDEILNEVYLENLFSVLGINKSIKLLSYKPLGMLTQGYVCLTCDDGPTELATKTIPLIKSLVQTYNQNIPLTMGLMPTSHVINDSSELALVNEMLDNYGCSVAVHGTNSYTNYTPEGLVAHIENMKQSLESVLSKAPSSIIFPNHDYSEISATIAGSFYGVCCTGGTNTPIKYSYNNCGCRSNMYTLYRDSLLGSTRTKQYIKNALDYCNEHKMVYIPFWHDHSIPTIGNRTESENLELISYVVSYGLQIGLKFINVGDLNSVI